MTPVRARARAGGLAARLYIFSIVQVLVVALAVPWVAHLALRPPASPRGEHGVAGYVVATVAARRDDPVALQRELARVRAELHAGLTLYDARGAVVASNVAPPLALPPSGSRPAARFAGRGPHAPPRFVVALPGPAGGYAVYGPAPWRPPPRAERSWAIVLALIGCAASSVLLARALASPLARLAAVARAFGAGDFAARTGLARRDEFGEVGRAFDEMAARVERLIRTQAELLANVSHELRTPLARIRVALEIATETDVAVSRDSLVEIGTDLDELEQLVSDVLDNARLELRDGRTLATAPLLRRGPVDVQALLDRTAARFADRHPRRALTLAVATPPGAPLGVVDADGALLRRALDNVLDNAAKYSEAEAPVVLRAGVVRGELRFEVEDRGIGIEPADLAHVGTPFFRTDRSRARTTGGIGLGLCLARRIAEAHGGSLVIASEPGVGTRVRITVPG